MRKLKDSIIKILIWGCGLSVFILAISMIVYVFIRGLPHLTLKLVTTATSVLKGTEGILPMIINTLYVIIITLLISTPIGIGAAIYLNEYSKSTSKIVGIIEFTIETLAGIPSIIYGLFGFMFFVSFLHLKMSILSGALTVGIIILPLIIRTTQESLKTVPQLYREGSLALGATKLYLIKSILIPYAMPGIVTSVILSIGRIVGESAALIFTAGIGYSLPNGLFSHLSKSGATLTVQLYQYLAVGKDLSICFAIASVLMIVILIVNFSTKYISKKLIKRG